MNHIVPLCTLGNLKSIRMGADRFEELVGCKPCACQALLVPSVYWNVSSITQNPILNVVLSRLFNMKGTSFKVNMFDYIVNVVVHSSYSVKPFFYSRRREFIVVIEVYGVWIKAVETFA